MEEKIKELLTDLQEKSEFHCQKGWNDETDWNLGCQNAYDYVISKLKIITQQN